LGEEWNALASALNVPAKIYIRANTLRTSTEKLLNLLKKEGIEAAITDNPLSSNAKNSIEILSKNNLKNSKLYKEGLFEFQDLGSQAIGEFCGVKEKQTVLDLCAGAGGKSLHLSALMKNTGKIYVTDYNAHRLGSLHLRARQAGCRNIEIIPFDQAKNLKDIDLLLMDAPCSGLGTIKRHPDIKWKLKEEDIGRYIHIQTELLETYKNVIHKDGKTAYATCSILPSESEEQVKKFIEKNPAFKLKEQKRMHPHIDGCDGFYMASIVCS
jgi:16S rRNA (cytosine967-C5)-methyltransferase